jgi:hypothetical protein
MVQDLEIDAAQGLFVSRDNYQVEMPVRFAIDFERGLLSMAVVMRAPLCVVNERRQQMAGLCQAHLPVRPERAVFQCPRASVSTTLSMTGSLE